MTLTSFLHAAREENNLWWVSLLEHLTVIRRCSRSFIQLWGTLATVLYKYLTVVKPIHFVHWSLKSLTSRYFDWLNTCVKKFCTLKIYIISWYGNIDWYSADYNNGRLINMSDLIYRELANQWFQGRFSAAVFFSPYQSNSLKASAWHGVVAES